ncbi:MFS transporter [Paenibacillus borealis]|uniref:MFS transporter n=1 Tax=Paenibacillus borealis TaxID=160799 RepID=A0A089MVJ6_PAEBO|nr:MFS transporter [Paenibacillus borealis]AIQ60429.1 hypothetical protein PBOR_28365 [Paenibacillus borealis]
MQVNDGSVNPSLNRRTWFLLGLGLNNLGNNFYYIGLPLLVYKLSGSATSMGIMAIIEVLPVLLLGPFIGTIVDRLDSKKILLVSSILQAVIMAVFFGVSNIQDSTAIVYIVYILGGITATNVQFNKITIFTIVPKLFHNNLKAGNAKISSVTTSTELFSPFIASFFIGLMGLFSLFLFNCITSVWFALIIVKAQILDEKKQPAPFDFSSFIRDTTKGFKVFVHSRPLLLLIIIVAISNLGDAGLIQLLMYYMAEDFHLSNASISFIIGISGIGAFLGTFFPRFTNKMTIGHTLFIGLLLNNVGIFLLLIKSWPIIAVGLFIANVGGIIYGISQNTIIHMVAEKDMLARVNSSLKLLVQITKPISISMLMFSANAFGAYFGIVVCVSFAVITTAVMIITKFYNFELEDKKIRGE